MSYGTDEPQGHEYNRTQDELEERRREMQAERDACDFCRYIQDEHGGFGPPHFANPNCRSGGHNHCTCDTCF